eukprot:c19037_g1_i2.p1 GENE.c19037_g1_i2~~c19037_g1_i2.p1  ORF type:complete len:332 (+),score=56.21 c19037_g1_i2:45-1040(+)
MSVAPPLPSDYQVKTLVSLKDPSQPPPAPSQPHPINPQRRSLSALRERTTKLNSSPKATPSAPDMTIHTKDERPRSIGRSFAPKGRHSVSSRPNRSSGKFKGPEAEHDSIVRFYGIVRTPKHFCFVMELLDGGELFEKIIEQQEGYPEPEACRLITTILEAVEHLHKHGVVHRDIKPENFLFDYRHSSEGVLKLIDFGFATFQNPHANMLGSSCGTPDYIAPELLLERPHNKAVDMWSVGVVLYTLLCSFPPFYAETDEELFDLIAAGTYDFPPPRWTKISADAKDLVSRLLQVDPAKRWTATQALGHPWIIRNNLLNAQRLFSARLNAAN